MFDGDSGARPTVQVIDASGDKPTFVVAAGEFDDSDRDLGPALARAVATGQGQVIVDMMAVSFIDSSVMRALLRTQAQAQSRGGWLRVAWADPVITRVFQICGLSEVFPHYPTVVAAVLDRPVEPTGPASD